LRENIIFIRHVAGDQNIYSVLAEITNKQWLTLLLFIDNII